MKFWTFETREPQAPKTLADAQEGVACVVCSVNPSTHRCLMLRIRRGNGAFNISLLGKSLSPSSSSPKELTFVRYLDPQPEQPVVLPATLGEGELYRLYTLRDLSGLFWLDKDGATTLLTDSGYIKSSCGNSTYEVTSATNVYATLVEV